MSDQLWWIIEGIGGLLVAGIGTGLWMYLHPPAERRFWQCVRYQGGGIYRTPRRMTMEEATAWLGTINAEVAHTDLEYGFIFYRSRGG